MSIDLDYMRKIGALINWRGKEYLCHSGLLRAAHEHGLNSIQTELISGNPDEGYIVRAVASGERGIYSGYGDASRENVNGQIATALLRMAETRAINRSLRLYTGLGMTTTEELPGEPLPEPVTPARVVDALDDILEEVDRDLLREYAEKRLNVETRSGAQLTKLIRQINDKPDAVRAGFSAWKAAS